MRENCWTKRVNVRVGQEKEEEKSVAYECKQERTNKRATKVKHKHKANEYGLKRKKYEKISSYLLTVVCMC